MDMESARLNRLDAVLELVMHRYRSRVPDVGRIITGLVERGVIGSAGDICNDHIAFRTMGVPRLGIASLEKVFLHHGYTRRDHLAFAAKKLDAFWYSPPADRFPRVFISELRIDQLSPEARGIIRSYTDEVPADPVDGLDLDDPRAVGEFLHRPLWRLPTSGDYRRLLAESEYAAWVIYNRYYLNHYTISLRHLPEGYDTCLGFDRFLGEIGVRLNDAGGEIKASPDGLLLQSSTVAEVIEAPFADGCTLPIAGSYVEFAERRVLPQFAGLPRHERRREHFRDGFEAGNADKIFESTFTSQTGSGR